MDMSDYNRQARAFWWLAMLTGICIVGVCSLRVTALDRYQMLALSGMTVVVYVAAKHPTRIPGTQTWISPNDLFVFLAVLVWGAPAATILAVTDALAISRAASKRLTSWLGGPAIIAIAIFAPATLFDYGLRALRHSGSFGTTVLLLCLLALSVVYFALNSFLLAAHLALKKGSNVLDVWAKYWPMGLTYVAAASAAWFIYLSVSQFGPGSLLAVLPVGAIILLSCRHYFRQGEERESAIKRISEIHLATVEALAIAIDAKDQVTHDHVFRVQVYACGLGQLFGLTEAEIEALKAGALLHDVGKIAVPDYILNKPGKLTAAEFDKMKIHTVVGAQIMERVNFPYPVVPIVRHHHERWDGKGYPDSLKGEKIPLTARVLTVADCFDAVREDRQYRKGMTRDQACQFLRDNAGTQFDPRVVETFLANLPRFEQEIEARKASAQPLITPTKQAGLAETALAAVPAAGLAQADPEPPEFLIQIKAAHSEAASIFNIARIITQRLDAENVFAQTASQLEQAIPYTTCVFYLRNSDDDSIRAAYASGRSADRIQGQALRMGHGIAGWVVLNARPMSNTDPMLDLEPFIGANDDGYRTAIVHPIIQNDEAIGALALYSSELSAYTSSHLQFVEWASLLTAAALSNSGAKSIRSSLPLPKPGMSERAWS